MSAITDQLTNRDITFLVWLTVVVIFIVAKRDIRAALWRVLRLLFTSKITLFLLLMVAYVALVLAAGSKVGAWQPWMLKDTVYWFFGTALTTFFDVNKASEDAHYFKTSALRNLRFAAMLTFIINLYVLPLVVELLLLPFVTLLAMLLVVAETKAEYAPTKQALQVLSALLGLGIVVHASLALIRDPHSLATVHNLQDLLLPLALTLLYLPLIYGLALYMTYESLFVRLTIFGRGRDPRLARFTRWQIVKACHVRLSHLRRFSGSFALRVGRSETRAEVLAAVKEFRATGEARKS